MATETSEAQVAGVQEPGPEHVPPASTQEPAGTTAPPASETQAPVAGEQPAADAVPAAPTISVDERVRRGIQAGMDTALSKAERRWETQHAERLQQEALQRQVQSMSAEELGQMMKDNQRMEPIIQQRMQAQRAQDFSVLVRGMLEPIADQAKKAELADMAYSNPSWDAFFGSVQKAIVEQELGKERPKMRRQIQDAQNREQTAAQTVSGPQLGAGLLASHRDLGDMTTDEKLDVGLKELWEE